MVSCPSSPDIFERQHHISSPQSTPTNKYSPALLVCGHSISYLHCSRLITYHIQFIARVQLLTINRWRDNAMLKCQQCGDRVDCTSSGITMPNCCTWDTDWNVREIIDLQSPYLALICRR